MCRNRLSGVWINALRLKFASLNARAYVHDLGTCNRSAVRSEAINYIYLAAAQGKKMVPVCMVSVWYMYSLVLELDGPWASIVV